MNRSNFPFRFTTVFPINRVNNQSSWAPKARLIAAAIAGGVLLSACGGGGDASDSSDTSAVQNATRRSYSAFTVSSPAANANVSGTVTVKGTAGSKWVSVAVYDSASGKQIGASVQPSNGQFSVSVDTSKLSAGSHTWQVVASSSQNGIRTTINLNVSVTQSTAAPSSSTKASVTGSLFYGINGHITQGGSYDNSSTEVQLAQLKDLGVKIYRNDVGDRTGAARLAAAAKTMAAGGVTLYPDIVMDMSFNDETSAYNFGYTLAQQTATEMHAPYYEIGNELELDALVGNVDGTRPTDYDNGRFVVARGAIRGMIAGVKSVDPQAKIVMGGLGWLHFAFDQMLMQGTQPDGTSGHPVVSWDVTAWHWYSDFGDIQNACGGTGCYNVLATLRDFGKPIWLTEYGVRPDMGSNSQVATYLTGNSMMSQYASIASTYGLESIQMYELYDDPDDGEGPYGVIQNDGKTQKAAYSAYKSFVASHPK
ncbi:hypothetical protein AWB78_04221 [Caballeronia calidae]|uniref:Asl1-like glycosyl hydrolase catalytic domain-containing protein n=1 Tax=Caballeronia calidae TaxID=1777139 RepID=A0A158CRW2_9BURK|nr:glycosyl hydrolase [Caballeronia calidae]SAK84337.1 hypothetical protein AWB78_04221 [Caballeronia calidae]